LWALVSCELSCENELRRAQDLKRNRFAKLSGAIDEYFERFPIREPVRFEIVEVSSRNEIGAALITQPHESFVSEIDLPVRMALAPRAHPRKVVQSEIHELDLAVQQPIPGELPQTCRQGIKGS
jgi:hypothetical protein